MVKNSRKMNFTASLLHRDSGSALLNVIIISGVLTAISFFAFLRFSRFAATTQHFKLQYEQTVLRSYILDSLSCTASTRPLPSGCRNAQYGAGENYIQLIQYSASNPVLIDLPSAGNATKIGRFSWRAKCVFDFDSFGIKVHKIVVESSLLDGNGNYVLDPLTNKPLTWQDINHGVPIECKIKPV